MCERFLEMSLNTIRQRVVIPRDIWTDNTHEVVKVVVSGTDAAQLSNESLQKQLIDNAIISDNVNNKCRIVFFESKRKRYV